MGSFFQVIRYVPNPLAGECMNVGVVALDKDALHVKFLRDWGRVRRFGREDVGFLREFANRLTADAEQRLLRPSRQWDEGYMKEIAESWRNAIQFSEPRASLKSAAALLKEVSAQFLVDRAPRAGSPTKRSAVTMAKRYMREALRSLDRQPSKYIEEGPELRGKDFPHRFDVAVRNSAVLYAAACVSFAGLRREYLESQVKLAVFAIEDAIPRNSETRFGLVARAPREHGEGQDVYERTQHVIRDLGADFVTEETAHEWSSGLADRFRSRIH